MELIKVRPLVLCAVFVALSGAAASVSGQPIPGAPQVTVLPDNSVIVSYNAPVAPPASTVLVVTLNGVANGPFPIGTATTVYSGGPVPPGAYTAQVVWDAGVASPVTSFVVESGGGVALPGATIMHPAVVDGLTVTVSWDAIPGATGYDVQGQFFESGQVFNMPVGAQTSLQVTNVPFGNYLVRVRGRNSLGVGPYSNQVLAVVGPTVRLRDLEVTLTWNTLADMDLHIIEPNGTHVSWERRNGVTAFLDRDNTTGFGPEIASVPPGGAPLGVYLVYIVQYRHEIPTVSTVSITLNVGSPNARTEIFTRQTLEADPSSGYNVALVDVRSGLISQTSGTRSLLGIAPNVKPQ
jgi:hypothetical protein